jgi:hypothetical protein
MTVTFLSRPLGRHVEKATSAQTNFVNPKKRYYASPDVPEGQISQTTYGTKGFQVTVSRTVTGPDGKLLHDNSFRSRYIPEDAIYLIGKGGKLPAGQKLSGLYPGYTGPTAGIDLDHWLAVKPPPKKKLPADGTVLPNGAVPGAGGTPQTPVDANPADTTPVDTTPTG